MPQPSDCLRTYPALGRDYCLDQNGLLTASTEPPLTPAERAIVKSYGGWSQFLFSYGLKPWNTEEADEGKRILESLASGSD
jgi:hypothetical protein